MQKLANHPTLAWAGIALIAIALTVLPFALTSVGTTWVRITNLAGLMAGGGTCFVKSEA